MDQRERGDILHQYHKFVAADASHDIRAAEYRAQIVGHVSEDGIAVKVAECVVYHFEIIDVADENGVHLVRRGGGEKVGDHGMGRPLVV
ncbi:hypothetical protein SDC9_129100 [bioreactor metagenome]|uniref:Uncharacterized protein n=1 Tax=bioreactor metagenome TaxID=1076179 RepID=A0A645CZQ0_9ZZZZ